MKISYISPFPPTPHGIGTYTHYLYKALSKIDRDSEFLIVADRGTTRIAARNMNIVPCFDLAETLGKDEKPEDIEGITRVVSEFPSDIVHVQQGGSVFIPNEKFLGLLERLREHAKLVVTLHTVFIKWTSARQGNGISTDEYNCKLSLLVDTIVVHQASMKNALIDQGVHDQHIRVISHGTEILGQVDKTEVRRRLGLPEHGPIILGFGFFDRQKNNELLIEALHYVLKEVPDAYLFFSGYVRESVQDDLEHQRHLEEISEQLKVHDHVIFAKRFIPDDDIHLVFAAVDVVAFPFRQGYGSFREFLSASGGLHLAIGAFKPIVVSRVPKFEEAWTEISDEITFDNDNPSELARILVRLLVDDNFRVSVTQRVKNYALKTSWDMVARAHLRLYDSLGATCEILHKVL